MEDENKVKPVSLGEDVAPTKIWNLETNNASVEPGNSMYERKAITATHRGGVETKTSSPFSFTCLTVLNRPS